VGIIDLNPKWIGIENGPGGEIALNSAPVTVSPGETVTLAVGGDGFVSGMTELEVLNPAFRRTSEFQWSANFVKATYLVDGSAPSGSAVILVRSGRETATLTGALRIHHPPKRRSVR
jgi:hypothetical protein